MRTQTGVKYSHDFCELIEEVKSIPQFAGISDTLVYRAFRQVANEYNVYGHEEDAVNGWYFSHYRWEKEGATTVFYASPKDVFEALLRIPEIRFKCVCCGRSNKHLMVTHRDFYKALCGKWVSGVPPIGLCAFCDARYENIYSRRDNSENEKACFVELLASEIERMKSPRRFWLGKRFQRRLYELDHVSKHQWEKLR